MQQVAPAVQLRIIGSADDVATAAERIAGVLELLEASAPLPCRGTTDQVRVYLTVRL